MTTQRLNISFQAIILALGLLALLPTLVFSGFLLLQFAESERSRAERTLELSARAIANAIDSRFLLAEAALKVLSGSELLRADTLDLFEVRVRKAAADTSLTFVLLDPTGREVINTEAADDADLDSSPLEIIPTETTSVSNVLRGPVTGRLLAAVSLPVEVAGVRWMLVAELFTEDFLTVLEEPGVPSDWIVSIVDRKGVHLARSHKGQEFVGRPLIPALVDWVETGRTGTIRTTSLEGVDLVSTVQYAPFSGWAAAVGLPVATLETPIRESLVALLMVGVMVGVLTVAMALLFARSLNRRVRDLADIAAEVGEGHVVEPPQTRIRELHAVGNVLSTASKQLHALTEELEEQVAERTRKLTDANSALEAEMAQRRKSEAEVRQLQRLEAVGQLTGGIAHDFNNMMAVVLSSLRLIRRKLSRNERDVEDYLSGAENAAEKAADLTGRLLAFARQQTLDPEPIQTGALLDGMRDILLRAIPENITVRVENEARGTIFADAQALQNAIINLAVNARDAMEEGGTLIVRCADVQIGPDRASDIGVPPGAHVVVSVSDTGVGMPPEIIERVFEPFFTTKPVGKGTGLGLSQVHGFIKQTGGEVSIESEPGRGTTVSLYLPHRDAGAAPVQRRTDREGSDVVVSSAAETVLVVEDADDVRKLTIDLLKELGYRPLEAAGGQAALRLLADHPEIRLLITDVVMPGMNGRELAERARALRPDLPVLFLTGYARQEGSFGSGLDSRTLVLMKPHTIETLSRKVADALRGT